MRVLFRGSAVIILIIYGYIFGALNYFIMSRSRIFRWRKHFASKILKILGVKNIVILGNLPKNGCLLTINHISYVDIPVLASILPCVFIAKDDVRKWPLIGRIAKYYETIFISRKSTKVKIELSRLSQALNHGHMVALFPEGTTSDGCSVLPFKSSYFDISSEIMLQPVSLRYTHINGLSTTRFFQKIFSWRGSINLFTHLKYILKMRNVTATLIFHPPFAANKPRKILASNCFSWVQKGVETLKCP